MVTVNKGLITQSDLNLYDGINQSTTRVDSTGGTQTVLPINSHVDALSVYGSTITAKNDSTLRTCLNKIGSTEVEILLAPGTWDITSDLTIPQNVTLRIPRGAILSIASGVTLTLNCSFVSGLYKIFIVNGTLVFGPIVDKVCPHWWGAMADGSTDDTAAIQAAVDSLGTGAGTVYFPIGVYLVTSTVRVKYDRQHLVGAGMYSTEIRFTPTANDVCFHFEKYSGAPSSVLIQGSITDMAFYSTDSTYEKTAINLVDTGGYRVANIVVGGNVAVGSTGLWSNGTNGNSIGIKTNGREAGVFDYIYIAADIPVNIADNPNSTLDCDHFHFSNSYLLGGDGVTLTNPIFKVDDGVNIQNLTLDGFQIWVGGGAGFYYVDTTTTQSSQQLTIKNVRHESATNPSNHMIRIEHNSAINQLIIDNCFGAQSQLGIKLREINAASLSNSLMLCTTGSALDVDSTVSPLKLDNFSRQAGSTIDVGTLVKVFDSGIFAQGGPSFAYYQDPSVITTMVVNTPMSGTKQTVANDGTISIGAAATTRGMLMVDTSENVGCIYYLAGGGDNTIEISVTNLGFFSVTQGSASKYNIYYDAGDDEYKIENKRGGSRDIRYLLIGGVN